MGKHKDKRKKSKKEKKHKKRYSSSSDSSDSDNQEWVEKPVPTSVSKSENGEENKKKNERDEWMNMDTLFHCTSKDDMKKGRKKEEEDQAKLKARVLGASDREINPYWKDGGTGLPEENKNISVNVDVNWLKRSLKRSEEIAQETGKSLEEVVAERYGSLDNMRQLIHEAEMKSDNSRHSKDQRQYDRHRNKSRYRDHGGDQCRQKQRRSRSRSSDRYSSSSKYRRRNDDKNGRESKAVFKKPNESDHDDFYSKSVNTSNSKSTKNWQKPDFKKPSEDSTSKRTSPSGHKQISAPPEDNEDVFMTEEEMNLLGAKIVKAEIMGKKELVEQMKLKLEKARAHRKPASENKTETVLLMTTDNKGNTRFLNPRRDASEASGSGRKKKVETHEKGQRVRYFADDDKYSLQQMFQNEKGRSTVDDDAAFTKLMSKSTDMDEIFEERITRDDTKQDSRERMRAIKEHETLTRSLENCNLCVESERMLKHTIVSMGSKMYLSLPPTNSLVTGHCILSSVAHISCQIQLDEDYWDELMEMKKKLIKIFEKQDKEVIFFETYMNRNKMPHMKVECVPLSGEDASMIPMYFKKALLECETEWAVNKKIVEFKNLQKAIPKGLAYFAVDFGADGGFAHVIEDERMFPRNFALETIGGMLDVDPRLWRRPQRESSEEIMEKVRAFQDDWNSC